METSLLYQIALTLVPGIGHRMARKLVHLAGSAEAVFREPAQVLRKMNRSGAAIISAMKDTSIMQRAGIEMEFIVKNSIRPLFFTDPGYPVKLRPCVDSPAMLYFRGTGELNGYRTLGVVGTRNATDYGKAMCRTLMEGLRDYNILIVSGLAHGIDGFAHRAALDCGLPTVGVLGHGLDRIYPPAHRSLAARMTGHGGLVTDFLSGTLPDRENFPSRNRIIAGMCDAVLVVEAGAKGGALITADIASSYNRDVFAVPGRIGDPWSEGTNFLIMSNKAGLIQGADDILYFMGWKSRTREPGPVQRKIFIEMSPEEEKIVQLLQGTGPTGIDDIVLSTGLTMSRAAAALLNLEFEGILSCLPGKVYRLV